MIYTSAMLLHMYQAANDSFEPFKAHIRRSEELLKELKDALQFLERVWAVGENYIIYFLMEKEQWGWIRGDIVDRQEVTSTNSVFAYNQEYDYSFEHGQIPKCRKLEFVSGITHVRAKTYDTLEDAKEDIINWIVNNTLPEETVPEE